MNRNGEDDLRWRDAYFLRWGKHEADVAIILDEKVAKHIIGYKTISERAIMLKLLAKLFT